MLGFRPHGVKVLCAGCSPEEKEGAEADVRRALGARLQEGSWLVSLVKVGDRWGITLDGPGTRSLACKAPANRLAESIVDALRGSSPGAPAIAASGPRGAASPSTSPSPSSPSGPAPASAPGGRRDRYRCPGCTQVFVVIYEDRGDEPRVASPVACPHCWKVNRVKVAQSAADSRDYRAEKA